MSDEEIGRVERELMMLGRHTAMGVVADCLGGECDRLERSAYILMSKIDENGPMSIGQLAGAFGHDASTINRQTAAMLRAGLVERIPDPDGGIARKFRITDHGAGRLERHRVWLIKGLHHLLADWEPTEIEELSRALAHFNASIERVQREAR